MGALVSKAVASLDAPKFVKFYLIHLASRIVAFWLPNAILYALHKTGRGARWKIQGEKMPAAALSNEAVKHNAITDMFTYWAVSFVFNKLLTWKAKKQPSNDELDASGGTGTDSDAPPSTPSTTADTESTPEGWSGLCFKGRQPTWWTHAWQVAVGYLGYDAMFYWSHRFLHDKRWYKLVHKKHHEFHTPVGPSCAYEHPIEGLAQMFNWYLPIGFAGWLNGSLHSSTLFYYNCFRWLETVDAHSGYEFPFSPFYAIPFFGGARMHDYHHRAFDGNYGASIFWDWLCGTDADFWTEIAEEGVLVGGKRVMSALA